MSYPSKDEYYLSKIREERGKVEQLEKDKQELIDTLLDSHYTICFLCKRLNPQHKDCTFCNDMEQSIKLLEKLTGKSIEELLK